MRLHVLGPVQATDNGETVALGGPRQRAVLALLVAFANQLVSSDRLIDEIWGEEPPPQARNSLQAMISNLRKALQDDERFAIDRNGRSYQLIAPEDGIDSLLFASKVDAARRLIETDLNGGIAELRAALDLWRGTPYSDVDEADTLRADGARLEELRLRALEARIEAEVAIGRSTDVVGELERLVDQEPLREGLHRLLMLALVEAGRQGEALRVAGRLRQTLAAELGIEPSPELVQLEQQILDQTVETPAAEERSVANPYRGLESFTEADADRFFGRDKLTALLVDRLAEEVDGHRLLAVVGASGSGKSSVVRAGLIPALRGGAVPGSEHWVIVQMVPGATPLRDLEAALLRVAVNPPPTLLEQLWRDELGLRDAVERILPDDSEVLLVIDQFEELFTTADAEESEQLINAIVGAVTAAESRVRVIVTLRADFYDRPLVHPGLAPLLAKRQETVVAMTPDELSEAIVGPAAQLGVEVEPALVGSIIGDATGQPGALPMLQYTMTELFDRRAGGGLTMDGYEDFGGLRGAIGRRAEAAFEDLDSDGQRAVRVLFLQLVTLLEADGATRRRALVANLPAEVGPSVIDVLVNARLLSLDQDAEGRSTLEVAHEALLREWSRLGGWIEEGREDIRTHLRLREAANEWVEADEQPDYLLSGQKLDALEAWSKSTDRVLSPAEADLVAKSIGARDDELRRVATRRRRTFAALAAATLGALVLAGFAVVQANAANGQRDRANLRELAARAVAEAPGNSQLGVLLAIEAVEREASDATLEALHMTLAGHYLVTSLPAPAGAATFIDEQTVASLDADGTIVLYDIRDSRAGEIRRIGEAGWIETNRDIPGATQEQVDPADMLATPDGSVLLVAAADGHLVAVDVDAGTEMWRAKIGISPPQLAVDGQGSYVAARGYTANWVGLPPAQAVGGLYEIATGAKMIDFGHCCSAAVAILDVPRPTVVVELQGDGDEFVALIDIEDGTIVDAADGGDYDASFLMATGERDVSVTLRNSFREFAEREITIAQRGQQIRYYLLHSAAITDLDLSPGAFLGVSSSADGTARIWDTRTGGVIRVIRPGSAVVRDVEFTPAGSELLQLLTIGSDGVAHVWDLDRFTDGEVLGIGIEGATALGIEDRVQRQNSAGFTASDRLLTLGSVGSHFAEVYDLAVGSSLEFFPPVPESVAMVPGTELVAFGRKGTVRLVDLSDGSDAGSIELSDRPGGFHVLAFSPSGDSVAFGTVDGRIEIVDFDPEAVQFDTESVQSVDAGTLIGEVLYDGATGLLTVHRAGKIKLWGENGGEQPRELEVAATLLSGGAAGSRLVVGDLAGGWTMVDTLEAEVVRRAPSAHATAVVAVAAQGDKFATGDLDGVVKLWDLDSGKERMTLSGVGTSIQGLAFNSDGSRLVVASRDGFKVFALDAAELLEIARSRVTRELTDDECEQYLAALGCD